MGNQHINRVQVVATNPTKNDSAMSQIALYLPDGTQANVAKKAVFQADTSAADLAALKVDFNALLTKLKNAGLMASS